MFTRLRQGFLDHLDSWPTEALDRANSVVTSKTEELNSELDLKVLTLISKIQSYWCNGVRLSTCGLKIVSITGMLLKA